MVRHIKSERYITACLYLGYTKILWTHKLRPISLGGGFRRAFISCTFKHNANLFAEYIMPSNYTNRGANFTFHSIRMKIEKYICHQVKCMETNPPSRCTNSLDIVNIFNEISREEATSTTENHFPHLRDVVYLLLNNTAQHYTTLLSTPKQRPEILPSRGKSTTGLPI